MISRQTEKGQDQSVILASFEDSMAEQIRQLAAAEGLTSDCFAGLCVKLGFSRLLYYRNLPEEHVNTEKEIINQVGTRGYKILKKVEKYM